MAVSGTTKWWQNKSESDVSQFIPIENIISADYNLDFCGFPHDTQEILPPEEFISQYLQEKANISTRIETLLTRISDAIKQEDMK